MTTYSLMGTEVPDMIGTAPLGTGARSWPVAPLTGVPEEAALDLCEQLTALSGLLWRTHTDPPEAAGDDLAPNSEGWRREHTLAAIDGVLTAVRSPDLGQDGLLLVSYVPLTELANQVGRTLHTLGRPALTEAVAAEVAAEIDAVRAAGLGDLAGRAGQAIALGGASVSPVQVAAALEVLRADPLGGQGLFSLVEPASAAVAAAHWLHAAARVAADRAECAVESVIEESDNIEAVPTRTPTAVLADLEDGLSPGEVVARLLSEAAGVARGEVTEQVAERIEAALAQASDAAPEHDLDWWEWEPRLCDLDPARPAADLLEDLLLGIEACWTLWREEAMGEAELPEDLAHGQDEEAYEEAYEQYHRRVSARLREEFTDLVRDEAGQLDEPN